ncbi:hypothetical protein ACK3TF_003582 [Chlorella vulgaris]
MPKAAAPQPPADDNLRCNGRKADERAVTSIAVEAVAAGTASPRCATLANHAPPRGGHTATGSDARAPAQPLSPRTSARLQQLQKQQDGVAAPLPLHANGTAKQDGPHLQECQQVEQHSPAPAPVTGAADHNLRKRQHTSGPPAGLPAAAADAPGEKPPAKAASRQRQAPAATQPPPPGVLVGAAGVQARRHNTRHAAQQQHKQQQQQQECEGLAATRRVSFAQGPWAGKFQTCDGHPDHEGQLARQRRSAGSSWGRDLTPSAVRAVESELGEACRPSIDRLKRRVGLLPLRKRSSEYYAHIKGTDPFSTAPATAAPAVAGTSNPNGTSAAGAALGSVSPGAPGGGRGARSPVQKARAAAGLAAHPATQQQAQQPQVDEQQQQQQQAGLKGGMPAKLGATFSRKRSQAESSQQSQAQQAQQGLQQQQNGALGNGKRVSQRLGGLFGPVGGLASLGSRGGAGRS